jgi:hypothetical protein
MCRLHLSVGADAIDAAWVTKEYVVRSFSGNSSVPLPEIAAIGDSVNDLPFLTIPGLGLIGAPANAQPHVKAAVIRLNNSVTLTRTFIEGFVEFYQLAQERHLKYIFADKDGVLTGKDRSHNSRRSLSELLRKAGAPGFPFVFVLTGSSYEQNVRFLASTALATAVRHNRYVHAEPFLLLAENGLLSVNVLTGKVRETSELINPSCITWLKERFQPALLEQIDKYILPRFGLKWSAANDHQIESVQVPHKRTMVTVNIPREFRDGRDYRTSKEGVHFGAAVLDCMIAIATDEGIDYHVL